MGIDCLIARAINAYPPECVDKPSNMKCVLLLGPVFCFDVPARRLKQPQVAEVEVEACFRKVACGPCCANPGGAACACGKFPGIAQWVSGKSWRPFIIEALLIRIQVVAARPSGVWMKLNGAPWPRERTMIPFSETSQTTFRFSISSGLVRRNIGLETAFSPP